VNPLELPRELQLIWWGTLGLFVGSFLNVAIHRLPLAGHSVNKPRRSMCPSCKRVLTWKENIPVFSFAVQRGRCRGCGWRIPWRYPLVELLTAGLWLLAAFQTPVGDWDLLLVRLLVLSGLVVATFVDFAHFEIPDEISIGGIVLAPVVSLLVPQLHASTWIARQLSSADSHLAPGEVDRIASLVACAAGMLVGGGMLLAIGWLGKRIFGREAMGLGDVKLLAGAGGFLGPGGVALALMVASVFASVAGVGNMLRFLALSRSRARRRRAHKPLASSWRSARIAGRYVPFGPYLALGIGIVLLYWHVVAQWFA
jgi:leader peptidase (prepilin peptidase) / N-methyltransferase